MLVFYYHLIKSWTSILWHFSKLSHCLPPQCIADAPPVHLAPDWILPDSELISRLESYPLQNHVWSAVFGFIKFDKICLGYRKLVIKYGCILETTSQQLWSKMHCTHQLLAVAFSSRYGHGSEPVVPNGLQYVGGMSIHVICQLYWCSPGSKSYIYIPVASMIWYSSRLDSHHTHHVCPLNPIKITLNQHFGLWVPIAILPFCWFIIPKSWLNPPGPGTSGALVADRGLGECHATGLAQERLWSIAMGQGAAALVVEPLIFKSDNARNMGVLHSVTSYECWKEYFVEVKWGIIISGCIIWLQWVTFHCTRCSWLSSVCCSFCACLHKGCELWKSWQSQWTTFPSQDMSSWEPGPQCVAPRLMRVFRMAIHTGVQQGTWENIPHPQMNLWLWPYHWLPSLISSGRWQWPAHLGSLRLFLCTWGKPLRNWGANESVASLVGQPGPTKLWSAHVQ